MTEAEMKQLEDFCKQLPEIQELAKALWGESKYFEKGEIPNYGGLGAGVIDMQHPGWQYHLQQMVIAKDPIKYLGANL